MDRNEYKFKNFGWNFKEIREILGFSQDEMSFMLDMSKTSIVSLEQFPEKITKANVISLITNINYELNRRKNILKQIDFDSLENEEKREEILKVLSEIKFNKNVLLKLVNATYDEEFSKLKNSIKENLADKVFGLIPSLTFSYDMEYKHKFIKRKQGEEFEEKNTKKIATIIKRINAKFDKEIKDNIKSVAQNYIILMQLKILLIFKEIITDYKDTIKYASENFYKDNIHVKYYLSHKNLDNFEFNKENLDENFNKLFDVDNLIALVHVIDALDEEGEDEEVSKR